MIVIVQNSEFYIDMKNKKTFITPLGRVIWSNIYKPNTKFYTKGMFKIEASFLKTELYNIENNLDIMLDEYIDELRKSGEIELDEYQSLIKKTIFSIDDRDEDRFLLIAQQYTISKNSDNPTIKIFNQSGHQIKRLSSEIESGASIKLKLYPKMYYSKKSNTAGISLRINEIHILKNSQATKPITKTISAKVPVELIAEFEKVRGEHYALNYKNITLTTAVISGLEQTIRKMRKDLK